jgi:hypothetical protein
MPSSARRVTSPCSIRTAAPASAALRRAASSPAAGAGASDEAGRAPIRGARRSAPALARRPPARPPHARLDLDRAGGEEDQGRQGTEEGDADRDRHGTAHGLDEGHAGRLQDRDRPRAEPAGGEGRHRRSDGVASPRGHVAGSAVEAAGDVRRVGRRQHAAQAGHAEGTADLTRRWCDCQAQG